MDTVVVAFISFILLLSIGFELAHHHLKETTPEAFQPILTSLYSELTLLGFIGLLMFTIFKLEILEELSKHLFGEGEEIKELGEQVHMVLFGVMDGRKSGDNEGCGGAPQSIRECLYRLTPHHHWGATVDLGDLRPGITEADTAAAVQSVSAELMQMGIIPIVIGGGQKD